MYIRLQRDRRTQKPQMIKIAQPPSQALHAYDIWLHKNRKICSCAIKGHTHMLGGEPGNEANNIQQFEGRHCRVNNNYVHACTYMYVRSHVCTYMYYYVAVEYICTCTYIRSYHSTIVMQCKYNLADQDWNLEGDCATMCSANNNSSYHVGATWILTWCHCPYIATQCLAVKRIILFIHTPTRIPTGSEYCLRDQYGNRYIFCMIH